MTHNDFEKEPIPGLPAHLPEGENIVWQGSPNANAIARVLLRSRWIMGYFAVIAVWKFCTALYDGGTLMDGIINLLVIGGLGFIVMAMIRWYARAVERSTIYTITNRRVVMRFGVALPVTFNLPYTQISSADIKPAYENFGSITLGLREHTKISWLILWPHVRPWKLARPEPSLRMIEGLEQVAEILSKELHAFHTGQNTAPTVVAGTERAAVRSGVATLEEQRA
ncbi:MAG: photosynthetic complex putative assembly protein PuhB [Pseudomonadota bacterium]